MPRTRNNALAEVIREAGWSQEQTAAHFRRAAAEAGHAELLRVARTHISQWVLGSRPDIKTASILCETLSRRLGRAVTPAQIGLGHMPDPDQLGGPGWDVATMIALADLAHHGGQGMDMTRRQVLADSAYSAAGAAVPPETWWGKTLEEARSRPALSRLTVTPAHVEALRDAMEYFSRQDQRLGGRAGRGALTSYLTNDVAAFVSARISTEKLRTELMSAAAELVYLAGWMSFDSGDHAIAQRHFGIALRLAAEADNGPLAGHILRAAAHQAVDLHHPARALELAEGSLGQRRYAQAAPRERALLGVVHARALALAGRRKDARVALQQAEGDLTQADGADAPARVTFFGEAALAHETAAALRDMGDLPAAEAQFRHSVRTRALPYSRTHAVTLGYLGAVQAQQGHVDAACATWNRALDVVSAGVQSGRVYDTVVQMRRTLSPVLARGGRTAAEVDSRAREVLRTVG
ncbi:Tat pathway signal protein [Streptomyces sp. NBC_00096]|uniref:Tat pathway signal protein n=1 Tax=Streptomyces sp. NBC_00096 TaxID=2975650 RepID=UPI003247F996